MSTDKTEEFALDCAILNFSTCYHVVSFFSHCLFTSLLSSFSHFPSSFFYTVLFSTLSFFCDHRKYDPYPCILGIPVMPALFSTCKFYLFVVFLLVGTRIMVAVLKDMSNPSNGGGGGGGGYVGV